jgi:uncharacterized protein YndB with AHSA1/START domain
MADPGPPVEVELTIAARPETIFRYFTDPARFARWMGEGSVLEAEPGGRLRVGYPTGQVAGGRVVALEADRRVVFTWGYEGDGQAVPVGSSTVEITLEPEADGTRVHLRHSGRPGGRRCWPAAWPTGAGSATRRPPSTAPARWPATSAWSSGWPAGRGWWAAEPRRCATASSASAGRPSARARPSWPGAPTWPGPTWTAGSAG